VARGGASKRRAKPRALVTGGAGFVGSHLCERLLSEGYRVVCMDNLVTGSLDNVAHLEGEADFEYVDHDVSTYIHLPGELDELYHFASPASPIDFERIPIPILKVGALGTHNALGLALSKGARFMLASTSEVYGDPLVHPQMEDYWGNVNPVGVRGVYDEAKRYAEAMTFAYHRHHGLQTRIVRIFNTFGPKMRPEDGRMIPNFVSQALSRRPLTVYGDGSQTRSVLYVDDLIEGVRRLMRSSEVRPVNIGNPQEMTVGGIAELVIELTGAEGGIVHKALPENDPKRRCPEITRARETLGWEPRVGVREGLKKTIDWFAARSSRHEGSPARR
jgi:dTDP-glucose 4,6-dehydratase